MMTLSFRLISLLENTYCHLLGLKKIIAYIKHYGPVEAGG